MGKASSACVSQASKTLAKQNLLSDKREVGEQEAFFFNSNPNNMTSLCVSNPNNMTSLCVTSF